MKHFLLTIGLLCTPIAVPAQGLRVDFDAEAFEDGTPTALTGQSAEAASAEATQPRRPVRYSKRGSVTLNPDRPKPARLAEAHPGG